MRTNLLILFFCSLFGFSAYSQAFEISAVAHSIVSGLKTYNQIKDRENYKNGNPAYFDYSKRWHALQTLEITSVVLVGIQIGLIHQDYIPGIITDVFLLGAIRWLVVDGVYNIKQGFSFFNQSEHTTSHLEPFGSPFVKISFLVGVLIFKYFILPLF
ncbi:MAG: hypothetical protein IH950_16305 [Bacteroidetes bacterium]|nr:hypothetical protein [Bacteroidota bacterium]